MKNLTKSCLFILLVIGIAGSSKAIASRNSLTKNTTIVAENTTEELSNQTNNGLITITSPYDVATTSDRLETIIREKGLTLFTRIDHSANAQKNGAELKPTQLLIFGNPKIGTPLMNCAATTGIDLPQKILVLQGENNQTQVIYNAPEYLQQRHNISGCDQFLTKVSGALQGITAAATK